MPGGVKAGLDGAHGPLVGGILPMVGGLEPNMIFQVPSKPNHSMIQVWKQQICLSCLPWSKKEGRVLDPYYCSKLEQKMVAANTF